MRGQALALLCLLLPTALRVGWFFHRMEWAEREILVSSGAREHGHVLSLFRLKSINSRKPETFLSKLCT